MEIQCTIKLVREKCMVFLEGHWADYLTLKAATTTTFFFPWKALDLQFRVDCIYKMVLIFKCFNANVSACPFHM